MARRINQPKRPIDAGQTVSDEAPPVALAEATAGAPVTQAESTATTAPTIAEETAAAEPVSSTAFGSFFLSAQQAQLQMFQEWVESLQTALRSNTGSGFGWGSLLGAQTEAMSSGLAQYANAQQSLYRTWVEMQIRWAQLAQEQIAQFVRHVWNLSDRDNSDAQSSPLMTVSPSVLYDQAQSNFDALIRQWNGAMQAMATARA